MNLLYIKLTIMTYYVISLNNSKLVILLIAFIQLNLK